MESPVARRTTAARIAAAKAAEAVSGIVSTEAATRTATKGGSSHHIAQQQPGQEAATGAAAASEPNEYEDAAQDHGPGDGIGRPALDPPRQLHVDGDAFGLRDGRADGLRRRHHRFAVLLLAKGGTHIVQDR